MRVSFLILCLFAQTICSSQKQINIDSLLFSVKIVLNSRTTSSFSLLLQTEKEFPNKNNILNATFSKNSKHILMEIKGMTEPQIKEYAVGYATQKFDLGTLRNGNYCIIISKNHDISICKLHIRKSSYKLIIIQKGFLNNERYIKQPLK